jgi:hypothetical protein
MYRTKSSTIGFALYTTLLGVLTGCVSHSDGPHHAVVYAPPPPVYVQSGVVMPENYVYYPSYQVYYSSSQRQYIYQEGRSWVSRSAPPRVSVGVLAASPSVSLDFHDSPTIHHAMVVKQYPKHWAPPGENPKHGKGNDR